MKYSNKFWEKLLLFGVCIFCSVYMFNKHLPNVVLLFDQTKTKAKIVNIEGNNVKLEFFNKEKNINTKCVVKINYSILKKRPLKIGNEVEVIYSNKVPRKVCVLKYTPKPNILSLIMLIIVVFPVIFFSKVEEQFFK